MIDFPFIELISIEFFTVVLLWSVFFEKSKYPKLYFVLLYLFFVILLHPNLVDYSQSFNGNFDWILYPIVREFGFN